MSEEIKDENVVQETETVETQEAETVETQETETVETLKAALAVLEKRRADDLTEYEAKLAAVQNEADAKIKEAETKLAELQADVERRAAQIAAEKYGAAIPEPETKHTDGQRSAEELKAEYEKLKAPAEKSAFVASLSDAEANALIEALKK